MSFCAKCGAYIPMEETACPACGYDPEAERKKAAEEAARAEAERKKAAEEAARRAEEQRKAQEHAKQESHNASGTQSGTWTPPWSSGSATQSQSVPTGSYHNTSGNYTTSGSYTQSTGGYSQNTGYTTNRQSAAGGNRLALLSYFGFLFLVPLFLNGNDRFARFHANQGLLLFLFEAAVSVVARIIPLGGLVSLAGSLVAILCMIRGVRSVLAGRMDKLPVIGDIQLIK